MYQTITCIYDYVSIVCKHDEFPYLPNKIELEFECEFNKYKITKTPAPGICYNSNSLML